MKQLVDEQLGFIKKIIDTTGPRLPTSEEERIAAGIVAEEFEKITGNESKIEEFTCHPLASIASIPVWGYVLMFIILPLYFICPLAAFIIGFLMFSIVIAQIFKYTGWFDFLFPKGTSQNVYSIIEPQSGKVDYTILIGGHIDSSWGWNLAMKNPTKMWVKVPYGIVGGVILVILSLLRVIMGNPEFTWGNSWMIFVVLPFIPGFIYLMNYMSWGKKTASPGAMDNLGGIAVSMAVVKYFKDHPDQMPKNCRIILTAFGCEEASLKGSEDFVKKHKDDLLSGNSWGLIVDGVSDFDDFHVVKGDTWLGTHYNEEFCKFSQESMQEVGVSPADFIENPVGGSDSAAFARKGLKTVTLIAQNPDATTYYHTINDTVERLNPKTYEKMNEIVVKLVKKIEKVSVKN